MLISLPSTQYQAARKDEGQGGMWWLRLTRKAPTELEPTDIERLSGGTLQDE